MTKYRRSAEAGRWLPGAQGAALMSQYGINVPPGIPVFSLDQVEPAVEKMKDREGLVRCAGGGHSWLCWRWYAASRGERQALLGVPACKARQLGRPGPGVLLGHQGGRNC